MRVLFATDHCYSDPLSQGMFALRSVANWLMGGHHECQAMGTARFETATPTSVEAHLEKLGVPLTRIEAPRRYLKRGKRTSRVPAGPDAVQYVLSAVTVTTLLSESARGDRPNAAEDKRYLDLLDQLADELEPGLLVTVGSHPVLAAARRRARERGLAVAHWVTSTSVPKHIGDADHVFATGKYLAEEVKQRTGLDCQAMPPLLDWRSVLGPDQAREFLTYVAPSWFNGAAAFVRLASMLGEKRPDIPILIVPLGADPRVLNVFPEVDFARYPHIQVSPPVRKLSEFLAITRLMILPTTGADAMGTFAIAAMANGVPAVVSDRGALPAVVGGTSDGGRGPVVLPLPDSLGPEARQLPAESEMAQWFDAICQLWDDEQERETMCDSAREIAAEKYGEATCREQYVEYLTSICPDDAHG